MSIMSWNCRGIGNDATVRELRTLVQRFAPSVLCLQETQVGGLRARNLAHSFGFNRSYTVGSRGRSGGLAMYWNDNLNLELIHFSQYHIDMIVKKDEEQPWRITCIYGEANVNERQKTWDLLRFLRSESNLPWVCIGDFNEVLSADEHFGVGERNPRQMTGFREAVDVAGLCDLGFIGPSWTFEKKVRGGSYTRVRLDRALATTDWWLRFNSASVRHLTTARSDHSPILLQLTEPTQQRRAQEKHFRYELMWETHEAFTPFITEAWCSGQPSSSMLALGNKLNRISGELLGWNSSVFGQVKKEINRLQTELERLRSIPDRVGPSEAEVNITQKLTEWYHREEIMQKQRSRIQWLSAGDSNTRFFQQKASKRRKKNRIERLQLPDGSLCEDVEQLKVHSVNFYKALYTSERTMGMERVLSCVPRKVTPEMNLSLNAPYKAEEVKLALFQMFPTKAPGPDGFPAHFFQRHWDICGEEVTKAVLNILNGVEEIGEANQTLLVLIPKVSDASSLTQFRPISLCNVILKIVSKVQANRLKRILLEIISEEQSAFVPGRLITDNIITAYECLHFMKKKRGRSSQFCALKLDMMKAYDRVEWDYLKAIMLKLGFSDRWVASIMKVVTSVTFSVLFNGERTEVFKPSRGIRQGDPISPYLFLLAAEGLSCLLRSRGNSENLSGILVAPTAPPVNHLLFADDSLLFAKASTEGATSIKEVVEIYCQASGQRINFAKSSIHFSKGCPNTIRESIKVILDVPNESLNERYLGMPSDVGRSKNGTFKYLKDRVWNRIQGWMEQILSAGGKEVLIKSVAQAVPTFSMACFKLPRGLCEKLNSMIRSFWWGSKNGKRKPHWISWDTMTMPKYMGGLGFKDFELFNLALLARQAWRILQFPETLSARIIKAVYFPLSDIMEASLGSSPSQVWRAIVEGRDMLKLGLIRRIGNGAATKIWGDNWIPRTERLRPVAALVSDTPELVAELIDPTSCQWNMAELERVFLPMDVQAIRAIPISTSSQTDFWAWHHEKSGNFTVRSAYRMMVTTKKVREDWLEGRPSTSSNRAEKAWSQLWKIKVPSKVRVFVWRLAQHSFPSGSEMHHRKMATSPRCVICQAENDSWRHSLIDCTMSRCVWALLDESLIEHMCMNSCSDAKEWLFHMMETTTHEEFIKILLTLWAIWGARRKAIHESIYQSPVTIHGFVTSLIADLQMVNTKLDKAAPNLQAAAPRWRPPPEGWAKIYVDGGTNKIGSKGAAAVICRNNTGKYLGSSARVLNNCTDPATLEAIACCEALTLAEDLNIQKVIIACDASTVIKNINEGSRCEYSSVLTEIKVRSRHFLNVNFVHEGRATNIEAHNLVKSVLSLGHGRFLWLLQPWDPSIVLPVIEQ